MTKTSDTLTKADDTQFEDIQITSVRQEKTGYVLGLADGFSFSISNEAGIIPLPGQTGRFYGEGFGRPVRGLDIDGQEVFYRSPDEEAARQEAEHQEFLRSQEAAEQVSREAYAARLAKDPLAFDWDRQGPSPEAAAALDRVRSEDEFPATYSGQSWRYAYRLWILTAADPDCLDGIGPFDDVPGEMTRDLDLTGFMAGWGRNAVRQMRGKMPKPNGAVLIIGEAEQDPLPSRGSANEDLQRVLG